MDNLTDQQLIRDYAEHRSEAAFAELARRHVDLVYSAAARIVRDAHLAKDVTQGVFLALAQNAPQLTNRLVIASWLHFTTRNLAVKTIRSDARRRAREQEAAAMNEILASQTEAGWAQIAPQLDDALVELSEPDRDAVVLRYFQRKSAEEMAEILGISAEAAQKRVNRAVERLRELFAKRGVVVGVGGLATVVSTNAVQSAPAGLAATISSIAASGAISASALITATKVIAMTTLQKTIVVAAVAIGVSAPLFIQHRAQARLRDENQALREQLKQQTEIAAKNEQLTALLEQAARSNTQTLPLSQLNELLRLRSEVGRLRSDAKVFAESKAASGGDRVGLLKAQLAQMPEKNIPELQLVEDRKWTEDAARGNLDTEDGIRETLAKLRRVGKMKFAMRLGSALDGYERANNGQLPGNLSQLDPYLKYPPDEKPVDDAVMQRYELLQTGKSSDLAPGDAVIGEKAPVDDQYDTLFKIGAIFYVMQDVGKWAGQPAVTNAWNQGR